MAHAKSDRAVAEPTVRRRRSREETRMLVLAAAARVAISRVSGDDAEAHNPLASVRIRDALAEVNASRLDTGVSPMTTGAVYHIWDDQEAFQRDLLTYLMNRIAAPGAEEIEQSARAMMAEGRPAEDILRMISDRGFDASRAAPELFLGLGIGAISDPLLARDAQEEATAEYAETAERLLSAVLAYGGRRLLAGYTMADLVWATEALAWGFLLRWRTHPELSMTTDSQGRSSRSTAYLGIVEAFTEHRASEEP